MQRARHIVNAVSRTEFRKIFYISCFPRLEMLCRPLNLPRIQLIALPSRVANVENIKTILYTSILQIFCLSRSRGSPNGLEGFVHRLLDCPWQGCRRRCVPRAFVYCLAQLSNTLLLPAKHCNPRVILFVRCALAIHALPRRSIVGSEADEQYDPFRPL